MATSKTLTPTNVTIQIPAFTDKPDQRVNSNCIDKEADAINALSDQIASFRGTSIPSNTDLNTLTTPGLYYATSASVAQSLSNCPVSGYNFTLIVMSKGGSNLTQTLYANGDMIFTRTTTGGSFESWYKFTGTIVS